MRNEILLIVSLVVLYAMVLLWYQLFGRSGMYCFTVFATIAANIEVLLLVDAFGMEMTLGNILFATTFLFILVSQSWLLYRVSANDFAFPAFQQIFSNTPRMMLASLAVYAIAQMFDVWMYHFWWKLTTKKFGDSHRFLWLRNNGSTLLSQLLNTVLFTGFAFWGTYDVPTLLSIALSSYVIFIVTSLADTPVVYLARYMREKGRPKQGIPEKNVYLGRKETNQEL